MNDPLIDQFMACEQGNVSDEAFHSDLVWPGGAELLDKIGPCDPVSSTRSADSSRGASPTAVRTW